MGRQEGGSGGKPEPGVGCGGFRVSPSACTTPSPAAFASQSRAGVFPTSPSLLCGVRSGLYLVNVEY